MNAWNQILLSALLGALAVGLHHVSLKEQPRDVTMRMLYCAYGTTNFVRRDYQPELAVAVVEVQSTKRLTHLTVSDLTLIGGDGEETTVDHFDPVEVFNEPQITGEGVGAYYLNAVPGGTRRWDGIVPLGKIRLRVRATMVKQIWEPTQCRFKLGPYITEGPISQRWPT